MRNSVIRQEERRKVRRGGHVRDGIVIGVELIRSKREIRTNQG